MCLGKHTYVSYIKLNKPQNKCKYVYFEIFIIISDLYVFFRVNISKSYKKKSLISSY